MYDALVRRNLDFPIIFIFSAILRLFRDLSKLLQVIDKGTLDHPAKPQVISKSQATFVHESGQRRETASTIPTCNPCTKGIGSPGVLHNRTPSCHPFSWV